MADNKVTIEVVVTDNGQVRLNQKNIENLGNAVDKTSKKTKNAREASEDLFSTQNKGIIGTANSTKSFSKLAQTIGGDGTGLVGAYATLAANAFAVSAAFNALRSAQQAEMVLQGLEAQGARTGSSLTVAADKMREIVGFGISSQEAMSATALFTSSGFKTDELERLADVAKNTSLALGRNLPDSLDRLIKGTTKLEPELLDELGIMTKLGDATAAYANKIGKTANSLAPFERKQAFLNAVLAEGELKFGGIADSIDTNPYDKLAASFVNLTNDTLNFINKSAGLGNFIDFLSENTGALSGVILLFASSIQKNLLGSLNDLSTKSSEAAKATKALASEAKKAALEEVATAKAQQLGSLQQSRNITLHEKSTKAVKDRLEALKEGTLSEQEFDKAIKSNQRSIASHMAIVKKDKAAGADTSAREGLIGELKQQSEALEELKKKEADYANNSTKLQGAALSAVRTEFALTRRAKAQDAAASAIQSASNLNLGATFNSLGVAVRNFAISVKMETREKLLSSGSSGVLAAANVRLANTYAYLRIGAFAAVTGIKAAGAAMLRIVPYIGIAMLAMDGLTASWDWISSKIWPEGTKAQKALTAASEEFTKILDTQNESLKFYNTIQNSSAAASSRATAAILNQATSLIELAAGFDKVVQAQNEKIAADKRDAAGASSTPGQPYKQKSLSQVTQEGRADTYGIAADSLAMQLGAKVMEESASRIGSSFRGPTDEATAFMGVVKTLEARLGRDGLAKAVEQAAGGMDKFNKSSPTKQFEILNRVSAQVATQQEKIKGAVEGLNGAFTSGETAASKFFKDAIGSTPFDDIVTSFEQINSNVRTLAREGKSATEQLQLISGIGSELQKFLSVEDSTLLDTLREADSVYQSLIGREKELVGVERVKFDTAKATLAQNEANLPRLKAALDSAEAENKLRQAAVALSKAQASVIQAQQSKYSEFLSTTAEGQRAQVLAQREINSLNAAAQKAQKAVLDNMISQEELKLRAVENELQELRVKQDSLGMDQLKTLEYAKQYEILLKMSRGNAGVMGLTVGNGAFSNNDPNQYLADAQANVDAAKEKERELEEKIKTINNGLRASRMQVEALSLAIKAATLGSLTDSQVRAKFLSDKAKDEENRAARLRTTAAEARDTADLENKLIATKNGLLDSSSFKVKNIASEQFDLIDGWKELSGQVIVNAAEINRASSMLTTATGKDADGIRAGIKLLEDTNVQLTNQIIQKQKQADLTRDIALAEVLGLNTIEEKAAAQKEILDLAQKESDIYQELQAIKYANDNEKRDTLASISGTTLNNEVRDAKNALKIARETSELRIQTINMEYDLLEAQRKLRQEEYEGRASLAASQGQTSKAAELSTLAEQTRMSANTIADARASAIGAVTAGTEQKELELSKARIMEHTNVLLENFKKLGPDGEAAASVFSGMGQITFAVTDALTSMGEAGATTADKIGAIAGAASAAIGAVAAMLSSISNAKIASIDKEIAAEEKRDGKSSQSVAKLEAMEKKKDTIARKSFNVNKKLMMAQAVMSTAAGITMALGQLGPIAGPIMAGVIGAMGMAQIAIISGTQYESAMSPKAVSVPTSLTIGKRSDTVDLAKGPNANAGGESGYLRGAQGTGSNASNYNTVGSAYGGELMRGYGNRGFVVGEKGPEVITPETPITVTPANDVGNSQSMNATINIQALDSTGVQDILVSQKGNIIKMLRDAANATGKSFMEEVNTNVYTRPNISKL